MPTFLTERNRFADNIIFYCDLGSQGKIVLLAHSFRFHPSNLYSLLKQK